LRGVPAGFYGHLTYCAALGMYAALDWSGQDVITSVDGGQTWTNYALPAAAGFWYSIASDGTKFIVTSLNDGEIIKSTNGVNWNRTVGAQYLGCINVVYGNGLFVGSNGPGVDEIVYSADGETWLVGFSGGGYTQSEGVSFTNGRFFLFNYAGDRLYHSTNATAWTVVDLSAFDTDNGNYNKVAYGDNKYVIVGGINVASSADSSLVSSDLVNWSQHVITTDPLSGTTWRDLKHIDGIFIAVRLTNLPTQKGMYVSSDGLVWEAISTPGGDNIELSTSGDEIVCIQSGGGYGAITNEADQSDSITKENYITVDALDVTIEPTSGIAPLTINCSAEIP